MPISAENRKRYPSDWPLRSRFVRFVRAGGRCEWCGAEHGKPHPLTGSVTQLGTAHVFDKKPEHANLLNLAALCRRCHLLHDLPDNLASRIETAAADRVRLDTINGVRTLF